MRLEPLAAYWPQLVAVLSVLVVLKYTIWYWMVFAGGVLASVAVVVWISVLIPVKRTKARSSWQFRFMSEWDDRVAGVLPQKTVHRPIFSDVFLISEVVDDFIDLILKEFVSGWYRNISKLSVFEDSIKRELQHVFEQLRARLEKVDLAELVVGKLLPLMNDHFVHYTKTQELVRSDDDVQVARAYNRGKLHPAVLLTPDDKEKRYLRDKIGRVLPLLLSEEESLNETAVALVREIVACTILANVVSMVSEGDFYNLLIVKLIGDNLKHRQQVKKLREVLEEHTAQKQEDKSLASILASTVSLAAFHEFMKARGRGPVLALYEAIDSMKAPLEDADETELSLEFLNLEDVKAVADTFFDVVDISDDIKQTVNDYLHNQEPTRKLEMYQAARRALLRLQENLMALMERTDFVEFRQNPLYERLAQIKDDTRMPSIKFATGTYVPPAVKAVEDAFSQIMNTELEPEEDDRKSLFGDTSSLFGDDVAVRNSRLFDDSDESGTDTDSLHSLVELDSAVSDLVHLAAPGNLRLLEEITKLTDEIQLLADQQAILEPLITKAELTNNITELRILRKSKASLEREISLKELQKQQYIVQENDNSLYGKLRVSIQSYIPGTEKGKEFILYIVEVQKLSENTVTAGWIVARRFSQFYKLHEYLRTKYPEVAQLRFPKRTVSMLKFQQRQLVELRKTALEEYLQALIQIPQVCSNKAFRSFLSSENFTIRKNQPFDDNLPTLRDNMELVANKVYTGLQRISNPGSRPQNDELTKNFDEMQRELRLFDSDNKRAFVKPICDLLLSVFRLNSSKSWLRGRALLVILQQLLGTTIERKVYDLTANVTREEPILDVLTMLKNIIFPNGKFKDPPVVRTFFEQSSTKQEARLLLQTLMAETCSKIFGVSNTAYASLRLFGMLQNDYLNRHLVFEIFDELLGALFPELNLV